MKINLIILFFVVVFNACNFDEETDKYPITYVVISNPGRWEEITYICGELRYLPNGGVKCLERCADGQPSKDSIYFAGGIKIMSANDYFYK